MLQDVSQPAQDFEVEVENRPAALATALLFSGAIVIGALIGLVSPVAGETISGWLDVTILLMIGLLLFELRLGDAVRAYGNLKFIAIAWSANFILIPVIGFAIASLLLDQQPLLFVGLMIYFLAPCTDWFLGFARMAGGASELGAALIPVNLCTQLLLFPLWLWVLTQHSQLIDFSMMPMLLLQWFLMPLALSQFVRLTLTKMLPACRMDRVLAVTGRALPIVIAALIVQIFAAHMGAVTENWSAFAAIAIAVMIFFLATFILGAVISRAASLPHRQRVLLSITMAARNAPLMLALTAVSLPGQPLVLAAIVFGMLVEIPQLTLLKQVLLSSAPHKPPSG